MPKRIGIVGFGYVGSAVYNYFVKSYGVIIYDPSIPNSSTKEEINSCDVSFVCVPTQPRDNGDCDTSIVEEVIGWLETPIIVIKSTVPPGTTDRLKKDGKRIVFSPEYCGESSYWSPYKFHTDLKESPWFTFGGDIKDTTIVVDLYMKVGGPTKIYHQTTACAAELAKYMENAFYAMKVTFCYEMANIIKLCGEDYHRVREAFLLDPRVNPMHTAVFDSNQYPFGGKCFPKDVMAIIHHAQEIGYDPQLLMEIIRSNIRIGKYRSESFL